MKKDKLGKKRPYLIQLFEGKVAELERERDRLRHGLSACGHKPGEVVDECDAAHNESERADACERIVRLNEEIARTNILLNFLRGDWDGSCIKCHDPILVRLEAGIPTRRCCKCKQESEGEKARYNKSGYVPVLARAQ